MSVSDPRLTVLISEGVVVFRAAGRMRAGALRLQPLAGEGVRLLNDLNARVVVLMSARENGDPDGGDVMRLLREEAGAEVEGLAHCVRGSIEAARAAFIGLIGEDRPTVFVVSDLDAEIRAGMELGLRTVLVRTEHGEQALEGLHASGRGADLLVEDLYGAAMVIAGLAE